MTAAFDASHIDATILEDCFSRFSELKRTIENGDFILVDRGFHDVIPFLKDEKNFGNFMSWTWPTRYLDANKSRLVKKCHWAVNLLCGRLKTKFKLLAMPAHSSTLEYNFENVQIGLALLNLFYKPTLSDKEYDNIAQLIKS